MNFTRLKQVADFLALPAVDEDGNIVGGEYKHKMHHHEWNYGCVRMHGMQASELGELPTIFPDQWKITGWYGVIYMETPDFPFWDTINSFFDITHEEAEMLFLWGDGNKKQCARSGRLHSSSSRVEVANQIARFIGIPEYASIH